MQIFFRIASLTESFQLTHPTKIHLLGSSHRTPISHLNSLCSGKIHQTPYWKIALWICHLALLWLSASLPWFLLLRCISKLLGFSFQTVICSIPITSYFSTERSAPAYAQAWDQPILNRLLWAFSLLGRVPIHKNKPRIWNCLLSRSNAEKTELVGMYNAGKTTTDSNRCRGGIVLPLHFLLITSPTSGQCFGHLWPPGLLCCFPWLRKAIPATQGNMRKQRPKERGWVFSPWWDIDEWLMEELSYSAGFRPFVLTCWARWLPREPDNIICSLLWESLVQFGAAFLKLILNVWTLHNFFVHDCTSCSKAVTRTVCVRRWECDIQHGDSVCFAKRSRLVPTPLKARKGNTGFVKQR